jgi:hypothetical protein
VALVPLGLVIIRYEKHFQVSFVIITHPKNLRRGLVVVADVEPLFILCGFVVVAYDIHENIGFVIVTYFETFHICLVVVAYDEDLGHKFYWLVMVQSVGVSADWVLSDVHQPLSNPSAPTSFKYVLVA